MHNIQQISPDNYEEIRPVYEDFHNRALIDYKYQYQPIEFDAFTSAIDENRLGGLILSQDKAPEGILIYTPEKYRVVEINVIHSKNRTALIKALIKHLKSNSDWDVISYAMLGLQDSFVKDITLSGFKLIGQAIVKFDFQDPVSYRVLRTAQTPELQDYKLSFWDEKYTEQAINLINLSFKNTKNANFDPRFLTAEGSKNVLDMIISNQYGTFLPYQTRVLLNNDSVEGVCFAVMTSEEKINIPIIAVKKNHRNKGMGKLLLKSVIGGFIKTISENKISLKELNATVDTDNYPAIKMYRRLGFKEEYFYPHAYFKNNVLTLS